MALLDWLNRLNEHHPWSHNDFYGPWVARQVRASGARSVLDVGCGTGNLIDRLRRIAETVTGFEPDASASVVAAARFAGDGRVTIHRLCFDQGPHGESWDAVTLVRAASPPVGGHAYGDQRRAVAWRPRGDRRMLPRDQPWRFRDVSHRLGGESDPRTHKTPAALSQRPLPHARADCAGSRYARGNP